MELKRLTEDQITATDIGFGMGSCTQDIHLAQAERVAQAQLDADKAQIQPLIEQAKKETAREIFNSIESFLNIYQDDLGFINISNHSPFYYWETLKQKYGVE